MGEFSIWHWLIVLLFGWVIYYLVRSKTTKPIHSSTVAPFSHGSSNDQAPTNDQLYERVADELRQNSLKQGLWARAFAEADGDKGKAQAAYIRYRVAELQQITPTTSYEGIADSIYSFFKKLSRGDYGLAKTYWLYGVLYIWLFGSILIGILFSISTSPGMIAIILLAYLAYGIPSIIGIWHSATKYTGPKVWAALAKVSCVLGALMLVSGLFRIIELMKST